VGPVITIPKAGLAKVQRLPYAYWQELKELRGRQALQDFINRHPDVQQALVSEFGKQVGPRVVSGKMKDNNEAAFVDEAIKSLVLRAGGSKKSHWAPWTASGDEFIVKPVAGKRISFHEGREKYVIFTDHSIRLDEASFSKMSDAAIALMNAVDEKGKKSVLRADFVLEQSQEGRKWWLIDVGESKLTFVLASHLHAAAGTGHDFAADLVSLVEKAGKGSRSAVLAYQNEAMFAGMDFEFNGLGNMFMDRDFETAVVSKDKFITMLRQGAASARDPKILLRFFRFISQEERTLLQQAEKAGALRIVDPLKFIPLMEKESVSGLVTKLSSRLGSLVSVPESFVVSLRGSASEIRDNLVRAATSRGMNEIVLKPGNGVERWRTTAFFYSILNESHLSEIERTIRKMLATEKIKSVVVEQLVGNGTIEGKKAEVRVWCLQEQG